jgi:MarR family 2-MHQ and catechol resistance regulon transcriptional repressor
MSKGDKKRRRALDAYSALQRAAALAAERVDDAVHPFGLSASQFGVLDTLHQRGPTHQQELAEALGRSKAQMTAIIDALEARDLVRRERHEIDRRFISVYLTEAGRVLLADAAPARASAVVELMRELNGEQKERLTRLCGRLLRVLDPDQPVDAPAEPDDAVSAADAEDDEDGEEDGDVGEDGDASAPSEPAPVDVASEDTAG